MKALWNTIIFTPLFNFLVFLIGIMPWNSLALAVIVLTLLVRGLLIPLSNRSTYAQIAMKRIQPKIDALKKEYPDQTEQGKKIMELYKAENIHPLSGCVFILIQLPIILALYYVFAEDLSAAASSLYSFVQMPAHISTTLLGIELTAAKSIVLAIIAGVSQYAQLKLSPGFATPKTAVVNTGEKKNFQEAFTETFQKQTVFMLPVMIAFFSYFMPGAVGLYWIVNNLVSIVQERWATRAYIKKHGNI